MLARPIGSWPRQQGRTLARLAIFAAWIALVLVMTVNHAFWRDEIRAFSLALQGGTVFDMLRGIHGEGHPALWYLLLRGAYDLTGSPVVLSMVSVSVAAIAALILLFLSPFPLWLCTLILGTGFLLFEYTVMARNYGISVPLMFLFAHFYPTHRRRGVLLGFLLAVLCNTNAHSVLLAGAFLMFWALDLLREQGLRWTPAHQVFLLNALLVALGAALCVATILPAANDAVRADQIITPRTLITGLLMPASSFVGLALRLPAEALGLPPITDYPNSDGRKLMSFVMFGSVLALVRLPAAMLSALAALIGLSLFFVIVYKGDYRHESLWLVLLISLYWIASARGRGLSPNRSGSRPIRIAAATGLACMLTLIAIQVPVGIRSAFAVLPGYPPSSRIRDLAALLRSRSDLKNAIVMGDPDFMLEALPYYVDNPLYFLREQRFGKVTRFTNDARLSLDLDDILRTARDLHATYGVPIVILLSVELDTAGPGERDLKEGYNLNLHITPDQVQRFLNGTELLARLRPASMVYEDFDVYELKAAS